MPYMKELPISALFPVSQVPKELMAAETKCFKMLKNGFYKSCSEPEKMWESKKKTMESHNGLGVFC